MKSFSFFLVIGLWLLTPSAHALNSNSAKAANERLEQNLKDNPQAAETLAGSSENLREATLEAAAYPNVLWEMDREQKRSSEQFQRLIAPYPRKTQEKIYNLVRYPTLVEDLVEGGPKSKSQIKDMTRELPKDIQEAAKDVGSKEYALLQNIRDLNLATDRSFDKTMQDIPESSRQAYRQLLKHPEILRALSDNRDLTLALGDAYRADPSMARSSLDSFSAQVARQNEEALSDYRQTLDNDPKAREELQKSAKDFAKEYGYNYSDDYYPPPSSSSQTVVNININPYPYWFGYPYWYSIPIWRPYPLWYWTGWYGWGSSYFVWGFPSYYYTSWFYGYPRHFYRYPYLANCYSNYYYRWRGRPYYYTGFNRGVNHWYNRYGHTVSNDMWRREPGSAQRWRDYGEHQSVQRRKYTPASTYTQPYWRNKPDRDGKGKPDFVKGTPRYNKSGNAEPSNSGSGRSRGRYDRDNVDSQPNSSQFGKRRGPKMDGNQEHSHGYSSNKGRENPRGSGNNGSFQYKKPEDKSSPKGGTWGSRSSKGANDASNSSPNNNSKPNWGGGSYGSRDTSPYSGNSGNSGNSRSSWGGSSSGMRERSSSGGSFGSSYGGGGSGRSRSPSFHSGGGGGRGRR